MRKEYIRSLTKNILKSVDKTNKYHDNLIDHAIETALNSFYYQVHAQTPRALGQYTKRYAAQDLVTGTAGRYAYTLTVNLVTLPDKRGGVRSIIDDSDNDVYFAPITDQELALMEESQADALTTTTPIVVYYVVRPGIIEFKNMSAAMLYHKMTFDFLVAFTDLLDADDIPLPYGKHLEIIRSALEMLGVVPPKDLLDNNSDVK
jgi:hypothetical protein